MSPRLQVTFPKMPCDSRWPRAVLVNRVFSACSLDSITLLPHRSWYQSDSMICRILSESRVANVPSLLPHRNRYPGSFVHIHASKNTLTTSDFIVPGGILIISFLTRPS